MKKLLIIAFVFALTLFGTHSVFAFTPASITYISATSDSITVELSAPNNWYSCFEYRTDGDVNQSTGDNYNPAYEGLYPYWCLKNETVQKTISANEYVEVRMVFGAESDERFDWTRFNVLTETFVRTAEITAPAEGEVVSGDVSFDASLNDELGDDVVQWAVRKGTCTAGTNTVFGNVDGYHNDYDWDGATFHSLADTSSWLPGDYCFIFNPTESSGDSAIRETREFVITDQIAPLVTIDNPHDWDAVRGVVEIRGTVLEETKLSHYNLAIYKESDDVNDFSKRIDQETVYRTTGFTNEAIFEWDTTNGLYPNGDYQVRLAARDAAGNRDLSDPDNGGTSSVHVIRVTVMNPPRHMNQCKNMLWKTFSNPEFKSQGDCVSWVQSNENAKGNKKDN